MTMKMYGKRKKQETKSALVKILIDTIEAKKSIEVKVTPKNS